MTKPHILLVFTGFVFQESARYRIIRATILRREGDMMAEETVVISRSEYEELKSENARLA